MRFAANLCLLATLTAQVSGQVPPVGVLDQLALLRRVADADRLWWPAIAGERCRQWSSFDRTSLVGPKNPGAWYANSDRGNYLRVEDHDGGPEFVMVECDGPGCVARIWSANPSGTLHFDVDGERVWSVDFAALCSGRTEGVPEPLAGVRGKGGNCWLPIPFAKSLKVSATAGDLYYQVDAVQFVTGTNLASFSPVRLAGGKDVAFAVARALAGAPAPRTERSSPATTRVEVRVPAVVTGLEIAVRSSLDDADLARVMAGTKLVVTEAVEGRVAVLVDVPLPAFFAAGTEWRPWCGSMLGVREDRSAWCRWPMPLPFGGVIEVVADGDVSGAEIALDAFVDMRPLGSPFDRDALRFRASYHVAKGTPTRPFSDHLVLDAKGRGRFVGCSLLVRNPSRMWWGEGDEKVWVDGESFPSWFGTGTEDYFGYAWCDPTPFQAPFHAQVQCDGPMNFGFTQLHRTHMLDSIPFQRSLRFEFERWHWVDSVAVDYATVAYWYGEPGATSGLPPVPPAAERALEKLAGPPMWIAENAIEAESLRVVSCTGGAHTVQDTGLYEKVFSTDAVRYWRGGAIGDELVLALPVKSPGRYRVTVAFGRNDEGVVVQCSVAGQPVGAPFDAFAAQPSTSGPIVLGEATLPAGESEFRVQITGVSASAKPAHVLAIDYVRLEAIE
ncbi:MAG: DUF2961 domain-containing protein [Planctomycetes bacterium]|nr:DUF2961 domain-containing protein [Planctomycetota bacterium]